MGKSRSRKQIKCSNCHTIGHNKRKCHKEQVPKHQRKVTYEEEKGIVMWIDEDEIRQTMEQEFLESLFVQEEEHTKLDQEEQTRMDEEAFQQFLEEERMFKKLEEERERKEAEMEAREEADFWKDYGLDVDYTMFLDKK
ncbi:hypothetical protein CTI12_AA062240 [Artemisia annua]|uniref:Splicing factor n=1 Tax=Artemisia annua TaxID=35608 RepID=A0A2U1Q8X2_ARTAN|nr:hypothetical protein CTI12_AA062240 [Artemisia annua]